VDLVAVAAFTAAGLSLANVAVSARLTRRGSLEQWRREQALPIVARMLTLSADASREWRETSRVKYEWVPMMQAQKDGKAEALRVQMSDHWARGEEIRGRLRYEAAQLDLLAGRPVREITSELLKTHYEAWFRLRPNGPGWPPLGQEIEQIDGLQLDLVEGTRADFGIGRALSPGIRTLLRPYWM
jgi:hypothetical protein